MATDRTASPHESRRHDHPHAHLGPVPHLRAPGETEPGDDHGPAVAHPHVHLRGGGNAYDHHIFPDHDDDAAAGLKLNLPGADT
jgi:hypothetical protein